MLSIKCKFGIYFRIMLRLIYLYFLNMFWMQLIHCRNAGSQFCCWRNSEFLEIPSSYLLSLLSCIGACLITCAVHGVAFLYWQRTAAMAATAGLRRSFRMHLKVSKHSKRMETYKNKTTTTNLFLNCQLPPQLFSTTSPTPTY